MDAPVYPNFSRNNENFTSKASGSKKKMKKNLNIKTHGSDNSIGEVE
jgi:hypothetical protein